MDDSDPMFLVEITVQEFRNFVRYNDFYIKCQFANVFSVNLENMKETEKPLLSKNNFKRNNKVRKKGRPTSCKSEYKQQLGQSILIINRKDIKNLMKSMKLYPMQLSLNTCPKCKIASTNVPWNSKFIEYVNMIGMGKEPQPISLTGEYNVFDEVTSRRMAIIKLNTKITYFPNSATYDTFPLEEVFVTDIKPKIFQKNVQQYNLAEETGIIKTLYSGGKKKKTKISKRIKRKHSDESETAVKQDIVKNMGSKTTLDEIKGLPQSKKLNNSIISVVKSNTDIDKTKQIDLMKSKSRSSINQQQLNILNYIFDDPTNNYGNQVYCVNYFTLQGPKSKTLSKTDSKTSKNSTKTTEESSGKTSNKSAVSSGSLELPNAEIDPDMVQFTTCTDVTCSNREHRKLPPPPDDRIILDLASSHRPCECEDPMDDLTVLKKVEKVFGGLTALMNIGDAPPCYCECECKFGFIKHTRYCKICKGYEVKGEDLTGRLVSETPFPCPIYHNLEKPKIKPSITSDTKKPAKAKSTVEKNIESVKEGAKETKKTKKMKKDDKFKFNYGYTAPHIGHADCATPCTGTRDPVPKEMGWLWTAEDVPGMKFRPNWKPGAVNKHLLNKLRMAQHPGEVFNKKKISRDPDKGKRPLKRPLLVVHKKDGEYTVTMETMKAYSKPRTVNQVPYEDKPPMTYTVGRTLEENEQRRIKKERVQRRLERSQRDFIQSAFRDMCEEICLKTYQQALGILPCAEDPDCTCYPADPGPDRTDLDHSCSCSEDTNLSFSDTDSDEWVVEFTPPTAHYDPTVKSKKVNYVDNSNQYTYLDYRVKLLDSHGNPVPRFFIGPDGRQECSDLGGFWSSNKTWLEINVDGYIGPDGRWAPNSFIGPDGDNIEAEGGKFQKADGTWLVVGIDGFVDPSGKWRYYSKSSNTKKRTTQQKNKIVPKGAPAKRTAPLTKQKSEATWSCFGDVRPKDLSRLGISGHGHDRKLLLETLNSLIARGEDVKLPKASFIPRSKHKKVNEVKYNFDDTGSQKCKHPTPSSKGVIAMDEDGNKIYFRSSIYKNKRPKDRLTMLTSQGISLSSFHMPCFRSFENSETIKKQLYDRRVAMAKARGYVEKEPRSHQRPKPEERHKYRNVIV